MDLGLKGKVALVTGTASQVGMGKAISLTMAKEGCDIIACDIDLEGAQKTADEVKALGVKAIALKADVANKAEVGDMVKKVLADFGKIDILVNTAGLTAGGGPFHETKEENWEKDIAVNLYGAMNCAKAVLPGMLERKYGKIINFSTGIALTGMANTCSYSAAKAGVYTFTKSLALEVGPSGINVNGVTPMIVLTNFGRMSTMSDEAKEAMKARFTMRRFTTTQDIANTVAFLASDVSGSITGQLITV